ncbi:unnamed protein product, partial [marine sediment metagenome]
VLDEGTWVLRLQLDDTYNTGSSSDGNVIESSVTVKLDRTAQQNYIDVPSDDGIIYGPVFPVTYTLGENSYSIGMYNTYLWLPGTSYVLNNPSDLGQGQHTVYLDGPAIGFTEGGSYSVELYSYDLAGNVRGADDYATASSVEYLYPPSAITCLSAMQGPRQGQIELTWTAPGDDGTVGNLDGNFRIDYSTNQSKLWNYTDFEVELSTVNCQPLTAFKKKVTGLTAGTTYFFRIWTKDERVDNWSDISNGATTWAMVDIIAPAAISNLTALTGSLDGDVNLQWTAPGDDGTIDVIADGSYKIKAATFVITSDNFDLIDSNTPYAYVIEISTDIDSPLETHTLKVTGLYPGTTYFFAVETGDEAGNWSIWPGTAPTINSASFVPAEDDIPGQPQSPKVNPVSTNAID